MKKQIQLYVERLYPYLLALLFCIILYISNLNFKNNPNLDNLIDGIVTMESIVIGLIGAIIPVVLSMKNESKFVKYVFENDTEGLFKKYLTVTIGIGLLSVTFSLAMYIQDEYTEILGNIIYYFWIYLIILFLLLTYRSMKYMILIIFSPDTNEDSGNWNFSQEERADLRKKYSKKE